MAKEIKAALAAEDKVLMEQLLASGHIEHKYAVRLQVVLHRANGKAPTDIAEYLGININTVTSYVKRYNAAGLDSLLHDKTRKPGTPPISEEIRNKVIEIACHEKPKDARTVGPPHWSTRKLARRVGISHNKVSEILRENGIKPHIQSYYSYSDDPDFETKNYGMLSVCIWTRPITQLFSVWMKRPKYRPSKERSILFFLSKICLHIKVMITTGMGRQRCLPHWIILPAK
jgi:transposase